MESNVQIDEVPRVDWNDLQGMDDLIRMLEAKIALPFENDALAAKLNLKPKRGVLLAGPPGTGKTTIGRAMNVSSLPQAMLRSGPEPIALADVAKLASASRGLTGQEHSHE